MNQFNFKRREGPHRKATLVIGLERETPVTLMGKPMNVELLLPEHTKKDQLVVPNGTLHWDNALLEVTNNPTGTFYNCVDMLNTVQSRALFLIHKRTATTHTYFVENTTCAVEYSDEQLDTPAAWEAGCDPSLSAYPKKAGQGIRFKDNWRFGGMHLNINCSGSKEQFAMALDNTLGLLSVLATLSPDDERRRREVYGKAGEYRDKDFGIEYRTLSCTFPEYFSDNNGYALSEFIKLLGCNVRAKRKDELFQLIMKADPKMVEEAINNVDKSLASKIVQPYIRSII